jgi:biopolymer transport protein ExbD
MARRSTLSEPDAATEINLSPMIDCIFILLIFFIVTTVFVEEPGVEIRKPDAVLDADLEKNSIIIAVTADNKVVYGGKEVGIAGVGARVKQLLNKDELPVIIQADVAADHGVFSDVWSAVKNAGAVKISVSTRND